MPTEIIKQGDSVGSIAYAAGLSTARVWNDPENAELRRERKNPDVLLPGDKVFVPDKEPKAVDGATGTTHRFRRIDVPAMLKLKVMQNGNPIASKSYTLDVEGTKFSGTTDSSGCLEQTIPPDANTGKLTFEDGTEYQLALGDLDPADDAKGMQKHLKNMGYYHGATDGEAGPMTQAAIRGFQKARGLTGSGKADAATCAELQKAYEE